MHECMNQSTRGRLKRSNFLQHSRILERRNSELLDHVPKPIPLVKTIPSWKWGQLPRVCTKVPGVADRGCQPEPERKSLMLEYVNIKYPEDQWTHAYTDDSAAEATRHGGGGVYIRYNDRIAQITTATGKYSINFKAEAEALKRAAIEIRNNLPQTKPNVVIFTDALSVLSKLQNPCQKDLNEVETALVDLAAHSNLTCSGFQHTAGFKEMNRQTSLPGREASWNKRTDTPLALMKRPSSKPFPRKNGSSNTQTTTSQTASTNWTDQSRLFCSGWELDTTDLTPTCTTSSRLASLRCAHATQTSWLQNTYCSTVDCMMLWPEPTLLREALWQPGGGQPPSWGQQASPSSAQQRRRRLSISLTGPFTCILPYPSSTSTTAWSQNVTTCAVAKQSHAQKSLLYIDTLSSDWAVKK